MPRKLTRTDPVPYVLRKKERVLAQFAVRGLLSVFSDWAATQFGSGPPDCDYLR